MISGACVAAGVYSLSGIIFCLYANTSQILAAIYFVSGIFSGYRGDQGASRADFTSGPFRWRTPYLGGD